MNTEYDVWLGLDIGKTSHHGCGLNPIGERIFDHELAQDETALREVITKLQEELGRVLVIVDQPNTIGALPVARNCGADIAYLPGLAMRKAADLYPGQAKTDARDAFIIANTARTVPHTLCDQLIVSPTSWLISRSWLARMRTLLMTSPGRSIG